MAYSIAKCRHCGEDFEQHNRRHVFCSGRCKEAYRRANLALLDGTCLGCGAPITYKMLSDNRQSRYYCNSACQLAHTVPTKTFICVDCGKEFEFKGRTRKLRCDKCQRKHRSKTAMATRALHNPDVQIGVGSGGHQNQETTLSDEARDALNARRRMYYAAHAEEMRIVAKSRYRAKVMTGKDKCILCGYTDHQEALVVHHKNMDRLDNDVDNLAVICANCHTWLHSLIRKRQKKENITALAVFNEEFERAELKRRNKAGKPDRATRTEGCEESQSGATHSGTSRTDMNHQEAVSGLNISFIQTDFEF